MAGVNLFTPDAVRLSSVLGMCGTYPGVNKLTPATPKNSGFLAELGIAWSRMRTSYFEEVSTFRDRTLSAEEMGLEIVEPL